VDDCSWIQLFSCTSFAQTAHGEETLKDHQATSGYGAELEELLYHYRSDGSTVLHQAQLASLLQAFGAYLQLNEEENCSRRTGR